MGNKEKELASKETITINGKRYKRRWRVIDGEMVQIPLTGEVERKEGETGPLVTMLEPDITPEENEMRWKRVEEAIKEIVREKGKKEGVFYDTIIIGAND